jgi:hypothetical protein
MNSATTPGLHALNTTGCSWLHNQKLRSSSPKPLGSDRALLLVLMAEKNMTKASFWDKFLAPMLCVGMRESKKSIRDFLNLLGKNLK